MIKIDDHHRMNMYLKKYNILNFFDKDVLDHLSVFKFEASEYIYRDGDYLDYFYFFVEGKAKVFSRLSNGKSLLLSFYKPLQIMGDIELFNEDCVKVNVKTISESYCIGLPIDYVRTNLIEDNKFLQMLCKDLGKKLDRCSNNSSINLLYPLENRLASYIMAIDTKESSENRVLTFYDSLTEISELLGTSYRHLHRTVTSFVEKGILRKTKKGYEIVNRAPLNLMANDLYS
ncbi:cyclic nucleotide-binding domain-containing protein [Acidaminobacter sp. JC074]|uniref:cyclic nucleotide-binding domain-containing protein n=1 Tax=Acidaminobacter sp. JC074 TaxID=2530199 RepID=UPI001F0E3AD3|nr:cyclic nucleotide-binding domain-containing protein [Acidaminobacter sp. JC074]